MKNDHKLKGRSPSPGLNRRMMHGGRKGKVISLALNFDQFGPQGGKTKYPPLGRINPLHMMLRTGTDAYSGIIDKRGIRASDDLVVLPLQSGTRWDGLGRIFYENYMWNGYDCREVSSFGAAKCGIEKTKNRMVGRGVFRRHNLRRQQKVLRVAGFVAGDTRNNHHIRLRLIGSSPGLQLLAEWVAGQSARDKAIKQGGLAALKRRKRALG